MLKDKLTHVSDEDKNTLKLAVLQRKLVLQEAKTALANHEVAEANYKNTILQLYVKYGLNPNDNLNHDSGEILYYKESAPKESAPKDDALSPEIG
jgi:hypothetical protein